MEIQWQIEGHSGTVVSTGEKLLSIPDFPGFFVGNHGKVYSAYKIGVRPVVADYSCMWEKKQFLIDKKRASPYWHVRLQYNGKYSVRSVHRLVAQAFVPNPNNLPVVNHKRFPSNRAKDLEWATQAYNCHVGDKTKDHLLRQPGGELFKIRNLARFCREKGLHTSNLYNHRHDQGWDYLGHC